MSTSRDFPFQPTVLGAMRRYGILVTAVVVLFAAAGALYGAVGSHRYTATASVVVEDPRLSAIVGSNVAALGNYIPDQVVIMKLPSVVQGATTALATQTGVHLSLDGFMSKLSVANASNSDLITVRFVDPNATVAQSGANAELSAYEETVRTTEAKLVKETLTNIDQAVANLQPTGGKAIASGSPTDQLRQQLLALRAEVVANGNSDSLGIDLASPALLPTGHSGKTAPVLAIIGAIIGLLLSAGGAYVLAARRPRLADRSDPEVVLGAPLIGEIANFRRERLSSTVPARDDPMSNAAETFRLVSSSIALRQPQAEGIVLAIVSAATGDGKTTVATNLAVTRAREGASVLVIDADFDRQALTSALLGDLAPRPGLVNILDGSSTLTDAVIPVQIGDHVTLSLLTRGTRLGSKAMPGWPSRSVLADLRRHFDLVIIDTPLILTAAFAAVMAFEADLRLVVVRHNSSASELIELSERLEFAKADVLGYIYNRVPIRHGVVAPSARLPRADEDGPSGSLERLSESAAAMMGNSTAAPNWAPGPTGSVGTTAGTARPAGRSGRAQSQ